MIVLIEGPDGTGKTTLAKILRDKYDFIYIHLGPCADIEKTYKELISKLKRYKEFKVNAVIDRAVYSNYVYSEIFGGDKLSSKKCGKFLRLVDKIIMCLPKNKELYLKEFNNLKKERAELYNEMGQVYDKFKSLGIPDIFDRFKENGVQYVDSFIQSNR